MGRPRDLQEKKTREGRKGENEPGSVHTQRKFKGRDRGTGAQRQGDTSVHFSDPFLFLLYLGCLALINAVLPRINRGQWEASQFRERPLWPRRDSAVNVPGNE